MKAWGLYAAVIGGAFAYNHFTSAERDDSGAIIGAGTIDAFSLQVGDCFNDAATNAFDGEQEITGVAGVPCSDSHDNEIFAVYDIDSAEFPEGDLMSELAWDGCYERFESFVGRDYETSALDIVTMYPTKGSWDQQKDREVICAVYDMNLAKLTGSVAGLGL